MSTQLRISGIIKESIVDGPGIRLVIFAQGCRHHCPGCHNPETHSFEGGQLITIAEILGMMKRNPLLDGITLSGGDPFEQAAEFAELARETRKAGLNVVTYTGYTYE
ncbi:MAG: nrdG, partial [Clostridiales bacterium]|nr:nrdG [Clostridiales bacterium]